MKSGKMTTLRRVRLASVVLASALSLPMISMLGIAKTAKVRAAEKNEQNTQLGVTQIAEPVVPTDFTDPWKGSYVYYGKYDGEPIMFRVLDTDATDFGAESLFLDSDKILFDAKYNNVYKLTVWDESDLHYALNGSSFLTKEGVFTDAERDAILSSTVETTPLEGLDPTPMSIFKNYMGLKGDKIFLLDARDLMTEKYGYEKVYNGGNSLVSSNGRVKRSLTGGKLNYWLRTACYSASSTLVREVGSFGATNNTNIPIGVAPAMNITRGSILFSSLISGNAGEVGAAYKLTIKDSGLKVTVPSDKKVVLDINKITIPYEISGARAGEATQLSVLVTDKKYTEKDAKILLYGQVNEEGALAKKGEVSVTLPDTVAGTCGDDYFVYLIAEDVNGEYETDYASEPCEISVDKRSIYIDLREQTAKISNLEATSIFLAVLTEVVTSRSEHKVEPGFGEGVFLYIDLDKDGNEDFMWSLDYSTMVKRLPTTNIRGTYSIGEEDLKKLQLDSFDFEFARTLIPDVSVDVKAPALGEKPDYSSVLPNDVHYYTVANTVDPDLMKDGVEWIDVTANTPLNVTANEKFKANHQYSVNILVSAENEYKFSSSTKFTINGKNPSKVTVLEDRLALVEYEFAKLVPTNTPTPTPKPATPTPTTKPATPTPTAKPATPTPKPGTPGQPTPTTAPGNPGKPGDPTVTPKPGTPGQPGQPTPTTAPGNPGKPGDPTVTPKPGQPGQPGQPTPTTVPGKPAPTEAPSKEPTFKDFVERLYVIALNRASEPEGKAFWVSKVENGEYNGADCARFFLLEAPEFMNRGLGDEDFVEILYRTFFDRASDAAGKKGWVDAIKSGKMTRALVVENFIESTEWCNICATYGVRSGAKWHKAEFASKNAINFATRLYTCCLGRAAEDAGLKYWSLALTNLEQTGCSAAKEFFKSAEFVNLKLKDDEYVKRLYKTFMDREPEASEVAYWVGEINAGRQTRDSVLSFFGQSEEFTKICKKYGIERGEI